MSQILLSTDRVSAVGDATKVVIAWDGEATLAELHAALDVAQHAIPGAVVREEFIAEDGHSCLVVTPAGEHDPKATHYHVNEPFRRIDFVGGYTVSTVRTTDVDDFIESVVGMVLPSAYESNERYETLVYGHTEGVPPPEATAVYTYESRERAVEGHDLLVAEIAAGVYTFVPGTERRF